MPELILLLAAAISILYRHANPTKEFAGNLNNGIRQLWTYSAAALIA